MRLIDADELNTDIVVKRNALDTSAVVERGGYIALNRVLAMIEEQPTIDAVPVVRCRDCKWYGTYQLTKYGEYDKRYKPTVCIRGEYSIMRNEDWYCADGERRTDE